MPGAGSTADGRLEVSAMVLIMPPPLAKMCVRQAARSCGRCAKSTFSPRLVGTRVVKWPILSSSLDVWLLRVADPGIMTWAGKRRFWTRIWATLQWGLPVGWALLGDFHLDAELVHDDAFPDHAFVASEYDHIVSELELYILSAITVRVFPNDKGLLFCGVGMQACPGVFEGPDLGV